MNQGKVLQAISQYRDAVEATVTAQIHAAVSGLQIHHDKATAAAKEEARLYDVVVRFALDHSQPTISLKENSNDQYSYRQRPVHTTTLWPDDNEDEVDAFCTGMGSF